MNDLTKGTKYRITIPLVFEGEFSHLKEKNGVEYAVFLTGGRGRYGEHTREVPTEVILVTKEVE